MILCKFTKIDSAVYIPHLDMLREMGRAVRRADLSVRFSEGFNPHMLLYFSQPLPLGFCWIWVCPARTAWPCASIFEKTAGRPLDSSPAAILPTTSCGLGAWGNAGKRFDIARVL